jgi:hypothetical protein
MSADYERLLAFLRVFTYKPGWTLKATREWWEPLPYSGPEEQVFLAISFEAPDVDHQDRTIRVGQVVRLPPSVLLESSVLDPNVILRNWIVHVIRSMEMHEVDEWARIDGVPIHDPHAKPKPLDASSLSK